VQEGKAASWKTTILGNIVIKLTWRLQINSSRYYHIAYINMKPIEHGLTTTKRNKTLASLVCRFSLVSVIIDYVETINLPFRCQ
jgi:hypothetical protein